MESLILTPHGQLPTANGQSPLAFSFLPFSRKYKTSNAWQTAKCKWPEASGQSPLAFSFLPCSRKYKTSNAWQTAKCKWPEANG
jgi:hypothetical protein